MQITHLQAIAEIARMGSFRKAAQALGRSQPSLTRLVLQIEEEIGLKVFHRAPTGVRLTAAGERIHQRAKSVLDEVSRLADEAAQLKGIQRGTLRVAVSPAIGSAFLPGVLGPFRRKWPGVQLEVLDALYPDSLRMLRDGQVELVIGPVPERIPDPAILVETLAELHVVVVTHHRNPRREATCLHDLSDANWLVHGPVDGPSSLFAPDLPSLPGTGFTRCHSLTTLLAVMVESDGFALLSDRLLTQLAAHYDLVEVPVSDPLPTFTLSMVTRRHTQITPAADTLIRNLKEHTSRLVTRTQYS